MEIQLGQYDAAQEAVDGMTWMEVCQKYKPEITEAEVDYIMWNETCYPFNDRLAVKQIEEYFSI